MRCTSFALPLVVLITLGCGKDIVEGQAAGSESGDTNAEAGGSCESHSDCGPGERCQGDTCRANLPGGPCDDSSNCVGGQVCELDTCTSNDDDDAGDGDMTCGGELYSADNVPPNIMIVLDRSNSMNNSLGGGQGTKWNVAKAAIAQIVEDYGEQVFFGLMLYPGFNQSCNQGMQCAQGVVGVDVGPSTAAQITDYLDNAGTCSFGTPTAASLAFLRDHDGLADLQRANYVLLVTDGQSTCTDPVPEVVALRDENPEIKTFVVGFGNAVDADELNDMAEAGGTALPGDTKYYQADDAQALSDAFADIAGNILSCSYVLDQVPPNPDELYIYIDNVLIERDTTHTNGWDYDPATNQITFYGPSCALLQSGTVMDLQIIFGCPGIG